MVVIVIQVQATAMVILKTLEFRLVHDGMKGSGVFNAKGLFRTVTYSVEQLTACWVEETSVHFVFFVDNDYNIRLGTVYIVGSMSVIGYRGNIPTKFFLYWRGLKLTSSCH